MVDRDILEAACLAFNDLHPVGAKVRVYDDTKGRVRNPGGPLIHKGRSKVLTVTEPGAHIVGDGVVVAFADGDIPIARIKWGELHA
jgi:hypothetical protein